jgi:hypothetical protein
VAEKTIETGTGDATKPGATDPDVPFNMAGQKVVLLRSSSGPRRRTEVLASWTRALLPTAVLVITPLDIARVEVADQDAISLDADDIASGPLSLADAIAKAAGRRPE